MEDNKIEKWTLEDGRKAEKVIVEKKLDNEEVERVIEIKIENYSTTGWSKVNPFWY